MKHKQTEDQFTKEEVQRRFDAALRGARIAGHRPKESLSPKSGKKQRVRKAKS